VKLILLTAMLITTTVSGFSKTSLTAHADETTPPSDNTVNGQAMNLMADQLSLAARSKYRSAGYYGIASGICLADWIASYLYGGFGTGVCLGASLGAAGLVVIDQTTTMHTTIGEVKKYKENIGGDWYTGLQDAATNAIMNPAILAATSKLIIDLFAEKATESALSNSASAFLGFVANLASVKIESDGGSAFADASAESKKRGDQFRERDATVVVNPPVNQSENIYVVDNGSTQSGGSTNSSGSTAGASSRGDITAKSNSRSNLARNPASTDPCRSGKAEDMVACMSKNAAVAKALADPKLNRLLSDKTGKDLRANLIDFAQQAQSNPKQFRSSLQSFAQAMTAGTTGFGSKGMSSDKLDNLMTETDKLVLAEFSKSGSKSGRKIASTSNSENKITVADFRKRKNNGEGFPLNFDDLFKSDSKDTASIDEKLKISDARESGVPGYGADAWENPEVSLFDRVEYVYRQTSLARVPASE